MARSRKNSSRSAAWVVLLLLAAVAGQRAVAQAASGYSEYYIPANEGTNAGTATQVGLWYILDNLDNAANPGPSNMHSVIAVTAWAANTTIYYDHWEDGLDFDPNNPATADETVTLATAGAQRVFESANFSIPRPSVASCSPAGSCVYDGGDRLYVAGGTVTVTRAGWIEAVGAGDQAVAWEIYPVKPQLTTYVLPFGENLGFNAFNRVYALIQATANGTTFQVDLDADGTFDLLNANRNATKTVGDGDTTTVTLNAGQTFLLDAIVACPATTNCTTTPGTAPNTLRTGAVIQGSSTLQVKFVAGNPGQTYCARGLSAFPRGFWTKSYYAPLDQPTNGGGFNVDYFLHNPHATPLTLSWQSRTTSGSFTIPALSTVSYRANVAAGVPVDSGLYFSAPDVFWGVGLNDSTGATYEWGYSLLPSTFLYSEHYMGWAPGFGTGGGATNWNDVGVFLTVAQDNTRVFVDYDNNGTVDQNYTLDRLQTQFISDTTDGDLSRAHIWGTGDFTLAYGENRDTAETSDPSLDLGYVAIPGTDFLSLVLDVEKSVTPQVVPTASGSTATFTLVASSAAYSLDATTLVDTLPPSWQFVANSATITRPDLSTVSGASANPTITGGGTILTWSAAQLDPSGMAPNQKVTVTFTAATTAVLTAGTLSQNRVVATGSRTVAGITQTFSATDFAYVAAGDLQIAKTSNAPTPLYPGDTYTYTVAVTNPPSSGTTQTNVSLFDALPAGITYVPTGTVACEITQWNVRDEFASAAFNLNGPGNTNTWATSWTETDAYGTGPGGTGAGPAGGFVAITGGQLQFRYLRSTVADDFANVAYNLNTGTDNWAGNWTESGTLDGVPTGTPNQQIYIANQRLRLDRSNSATTFFVSRTATVGLGSTVTISFVPYDNGLEGGNAFLAEYSVDGGAFVTPALGTYDGAGNPASWNGVTQTLTISNFPGTSITLRFRATAVWDNDNDHGEIDNVSISYNSPASASGAQVQRTVDLSGATRAQLAFSYASAGLGPTDTLVVEASNGGAFQTLGTFTGGSPDVAPPYDLTSFISATTTVRFRVTGGFDAVGKSFSIDNVDVSRLSTFSPGNPPDFLSSSTACRIRPGNSLVLTFNARVDNPFPSGQTEITNTAATTTALFPIQITASKTDIVVNPDVTSATVSGRIWLDGDGDGVQDIGESGIDNVQVTLKDRFGTPVGTALTDSNGRFLFTGVNPGTGYYVEAAAPPDPGGLPLTNLTQSFPAGRSDYRTTSFDLVASQNYTGANQGYRPAAGTVSFGDVAWIDGDADGVRDAGEPGLGGVTVRLYRDGGNNSLDPLLDTFLAVPTIGPGTVSVTSGSATVTGVGTSFTTLAPGDPITIGGTTYSILSIASATSLTLTTNAVASASTVSYQVVSTPGAGTVSVTNASPTVTGTGTSFLSLAPGDPIEIRGVKYKVLSVASDTSLTLSSNFTGTTGSGLPYGIPTPIVTAADGSYIFTGVTPVGQTYFVSASTPTGYVSTGPTNFMFDNVTGGVGYLTADFGFNVSSGSTYSIKDRVWRDSNSNGLFDGSEPGLGGVTVDLLNASLQVIATTTTGADGTFTFSGLPGGGADYTTRITDTAGLLSSFYGTTSWATARQRSEPNLTANVDHTVGSPATDGYGFNATRAIGDTVYTDLNGNGAQDSGDPGTAGVVVRLHRDRNGNGLIDLAAGAGTVQVTNGSASVVGTGTTFLNYRAGEPITIGGVGYTIASVASNTSLTLTTPNVGATASGVAYSGNPLGGGSVAVTSGSNVVTGTGTTFTSYSPGDPITIAGVTYTIQAIAGDLSLTLTANYAGTTGSGITNYSSPPVFVASATTDSSGQYLFAGLPNASYVVSVQVPTGYSYIGGARPDTDGGVAGIQLVSIVSGGGSDLTRDFGFQATTSRAVSGTVWDDADASGTIGGAEVRLPGVTLDILDGGGTVVRTVTTDSSGDFSVSGLASGTYTVRVTDLSGILNGYSATFEYGGAPLDGDAPVNLSGGDVSGVNFGYRKPTPTYAAVSGLTAHAAGGTVVVEWQTTQEVGTVGWHLLRLDPKSGAFVPVNQTLLPALLGHPEGGTYAVQDTGAPLSPPLTYRLVEVDAWGTRHEYGPYELAALGSGALPSSGYQRTPGVISGAEQARIATLKRERSSSTAARGGQKGSRVKAVTREEGLHYVDTATLAGLLGEKPSSLASRVSSGRVVLENLGAVVPYAPAAGGAGIYFHAERIDSAYTEENVYWIAAQKGPMMGSTAGSPTGGSLAATFPYIAHAEVNRYPLPAFFQDPEADFYTWDYLYAGFPGDDTRTFSTPLAGVAGTGQPTLTVRLHGGSDTTAPAEHHVRITWNGRDVGEAVWDGLVPYALTVPLLAGDVLEGANTLVVNAILEPGLDYDVVYFESFDVTYPRLYRAVGDELSFTVPAGADAALAGFSSPGILLLDVTAPENPMLVTGAAAYAPGDGTYGLRFANRGAVTRTYVATVPAQANRPVSLTPGRPAVLSAPTNGADYLLIAPSSLVAAAESLAAYRRVHGLDTMVVDLEDVHDEFGFGLSTPVAVMDFLAHAASTWSRPPQYVTLVGRGTLDYKDAQGVGDNVMPTLLAGTPYGLAASDVSFANLTSAAGRGLKAIGRLPVLTSQELLDYVAKVQAHESAAAAAWQQSILLTADNPDSGGAFTSDSDAVGALAPASFLKTKVYLTTYSAPDARTAIRNTVNSGALFFNYIGHGGPDRLASENIFNKTDVPFLTNAGRLPVFLAMTCSTGNFAIPGFPALGESIVLWKSGGAYATWAPSGLSLNEGAVALNEAFFHGAFVDGEKVVGRNCTKALEGLPATGPTSYMKAIYNIIGEPVSRLP